MSPPPNTSLSQLQPAALLAGRYRLERRLAQGGMAEVWVATDTLLNRPVAVKLLKPNLASDPVVAERFRREAVAVAGLSHPNIVTVYDAVEDHIDGALRQAVVMQLVNGKSLRQLLDEMRRLSPELTIHIGMSVATALDVAHQAGLVHRDVKPGNILLTPDGRVLLTDFGIAKGVRDTEDLTSENIMMGTAKYLSPEQVRGRKLDGRADLYSLGLVLYECLAGQVPFIGETDADTALARLNQDPPNLARFRAVPYGLVEAIERLLARRPEDRHASGAEVRTALSTVGSNGSAYSPTPAAGIASPATGRVPAAPSPGAGPANDRRAASTPPMGRAAATAANPVITSRPSPAGVPPVPIAPTPTGVRQPRRPIGIPVRTDRTDRTPETTMRPPERVGRPALRDRRASLFVAALLAAAAIVAGAIVLTRGNDRPAAKTPAEDTLPGVPSGGFTWFVFDPSADGIERDDDVALASDGDPATAWRSACYRTKSFDGKAGVGLTLDIGKAQTGVLRVTVPTAPALVSILASDSDQPPRQLDGLREVRRKLRVDKPSTLQLTISRARYLVVFFDQAAPDRGCAGGGFRAGIAEMAWAAK